ncbi:actin-like ATPase domain-containing protein [Poronia punctata]|nr:actin-like ATPase domain-containing protein [Poronia punctata]
MSSAGPTTLPHRIVSSIRAGVSATPQTPSRPIPSASYGSPSSLRADDDPVIIEIGSRKLRIGFAGDAAPKRIVAFSPEQQRRAGDFRIWDPDFPNQWRSRASGKPWGSGHELYQLDIRGQDLLLVADKLERELRDALYKHLILDSKYRRIVLVLPSALPLPLLSSILDTIFYQFHAPTISLLSSPVMTTFAAGLRSALVIDLGWHETTVTSVYEYREVQSSRSIRAGKHLVGETYEFLFRALHGHSTSEHKEGAEDRLLDEAPSFEECEEVATRLLWCKRTPKEPFQETAEEEEEEEGLPTLHEDEEEADVSSTIEDQDQSLMTIPLSSCRPPRTVQIPFAQLADPCETVFFETQVAPSFFDDHELPVHLLVYRALLQLPLDVRAICMSRIIFTGGCSRIIGLRGRILDEISVLAEERGWDPVTGKGVEQYKKNPKLKRSGKGNGKADKDTKMPTPKPDKPTPGGEAAGSAVTAANAPQEVDQVEVILKRDQNQNPTVQGTLRAVDSLGPWCGASLATQMKVPALATIDREIWLQQGINGASRPSEVDTKTGQRQSMGAGGLMRGQAAQPNTWTLGVWGGLF